jgi:hypothetical protein
MHPAPLGATGASWTSDSMSNSERFVGYIAAYARRDLDAVGAMLASGVRLRDWNLEVQGSEAVLAETSKNFAAADTIEIEILALYVNASEASVAGELRIVVNGSNELQVVDVISFTPEGKIQSIRAYLGRSGDQASAPESTMALREPVGVLRGSA